MPEAHYALKGSSSWASFEHMLKSLNNWVSNFLTMGILWWLSLHLDYPIQKEP